MARVAATLISSSYQTLLEGAKLVAPNAQFDERGYVGHWHENLFPASAFAEIEQDMLAGAGHELKSKFLAAHSSSALAVNTFAPWRSKAGGLFGYPREEFDCLRFEAACPTGLKGTPPHLDVVATGRSVLAIESKCTEWMKPETAVFRDSYFRLEQRLGGNRWYKHMLEIRHGRVTYGYLDSAQLIKHAFGLLTTYPDKQIRLMYLFWEPRNAKQWRECELHRAEVASFADAVAGGGISFESMSYPELWHKWGEEPPPHLEYLRTRYLRDA